MFQVSSRLFEIQRAFISLLGDNNDLVQDAASKGVAIVYEACFEDQREELVSSLLDTLQVKKVNEDTKVFQEGELGKIPEGRNLSTYKELGSLVTDMGQPDLVYKFIHLANYNATWILQHRGEGGRPAESLPAQDHPQAVPVPVRPQDQDPAEHDLHLVGAGAGDDQDGGQVPD